MNDRYEPIEVERGCHSCDETDCKSDARWKYLGKYFCLKHWKAFLSSLQNAYIGGLNEGM